MHKKLGNIFVDSRVTVPYDRLVDLIENDERQWYRRLAKLSLNLCSVKQTKRERVRRLRMELRWSAQRLTDECARAGCASLTRGNIAKIESRARKSVTADELTVLARVLGVTSAALLAQPDFLTQGHRTIVVVDVADFTNPARNMFDQRTMREGLGRVLHVAFSEVGVDLDTCTVEDRGDSKLILIPPGVDNGQLADQLPSRLIAGLRRQNAIHSAEATMKLRVELHTGEVFQDRDGVVGPAVNHTFRIVDAPETKTILKSSPPCSH